MSNSRMAGSDEFKDKIAGKGLDDETSKGKYTKREIRAEVQAGNMNANDYQELINSGQKFNGKAQDFLNTKFGLNSKSGGNSSNNGGTGGNGNNGNGGNGGGGNGGGNNNMSHADQAIADARANETFDFAKMEKSIHERPLYMQAQSDVYASNLWGDMWSSGYGGTWSRGNGSRDNNDDD